MANRFTVVDMETALRERRQPAVTLWNRLEGRPRTVDFSRALRADVRDALWMLTRQWQVGELRGEDAGSPVTVKANVATTRLTRLRAGDAAAIDFDAAIPLETQVTRQPLPLAIGGTRVGLDFRLLMGRRWLKLVAAIGGYGDLFIAKYGFALPDPQRRDEGAVCSDAEVWQHIAAVAGRAMDGGALYEYLAAATGRHAYDGMTILDADKPAIDRTADAFVLWVERLITVPDTTDNPAWQPSRFEYRFACSAPTASGEIVYQATEHHRDGVDWYSVDAAAPPASLGAAQAPDPRQNIVRTMLPVPVTYPGMPLPRWWAFEDGRTNFGEIRPDTTDLAKLLFIEFGLVYSNDWFTIPFTFDAGSIATVEGLAVTNVFGERFWIAPAGSRAGDAWQQWSLFSTDATDGTPSGAASSIIMFPTAAKVQAGAPLEDVLLLRDEMANTVWGVERTVHAPDGRGRAAATLGRELRAFHERLVAGGPQAPVPVPLPNDAPIRYELMSEVPEHWIPFIAARVPGSNRAIRLQRASLLRIIDRDPLPPQRITPRTVLLRPGLDASPQVPYFVPEEEVPRGGTRVTLSFRRTRGTDGRAFVWLAASKQTGRGEGSSGLAYDQAVKKDTQG
jgi:hypothetical protein